MDKSVIGTLIPNQMAEKIDSAVKSGKYINKSDWLRQAIREKLELEK